MAIKTFEDLNKYLGKIPYISYGGCAIAALFQYLWLKQNDKDADVKVVYLYQSHNQYKLENNKRTLHGIDNGYYSCSHAVILYNDQHIDCSDDEFDIDSCDYKSSLEIDNPEFVIKTLGERYEWNSMFDRETFVPKMEKKIGIKLNLVVN